MIRPLELGTHRGTHLDAPRHVLEGGRSLDDYPVGWFGGSGVVVDARGHGPRGWPPAPKPGSIALRLFE